MSLSSYLPTFALVYQCHEWTTDASWCSRDCEGLTEVAIGLNDEARQSWDDDFIDILDFRPDNTFLIKVTQRFNW